MSRVESYVQVGPLQVAEPLHRWVRERALPGIEVARRLDKAFERAGL